MSRFAFSLAFAFLFELAADDDEQNNLIFTRIRSK